MEQSKAGQKSENHDGKDALSTGKGHLHVQISEAVVDGEGSSFNPGDAQESDVDERQGCSTSGKLAAKNAVGRPAVSPLPVAPASTLENDADLVDDHPATSIDLFRAVRYLTHMSELIYTLAAVRQLVRDGAVDDHRLLCLPISLEEGQKLAIVHRKALLEHLGEKSYDLFVGDRQDFADARRSALASYDLEDARTGVLTGDDGAARGDRGRPVVLEMGDATEGATYNVGLYSRRKIVVVSFRGTSSIDDIAGDMRMHMTPLTNPVKCTAVGGSCGGAKIKVHAGFHDYLFGRTSLSSPTPPLSPCKDPEIQPPSRFDFILNLVIDILRANPGFRLYVTGHSLGAALATLFAFAVAASDIADIPYPVMCVNVASPMVGNIPFCLAFRALELEGRVRQLRIVRQEDVIPRGPARCFWIGGPMDLYHHVGMELKFLSNRPRYLIKFENAPTGPISLLRYMINMNWQRFLLTFYLCMVGFWKVLSFHSCAKYSERIGESRHSLEKINLKDLYGRALKHGERGVLVKG